MLNNCEFIDLGFSGPHFTWSNLRQADDLNRERIDRAVANAAWKCNFPDTEVTHLPRVHSDHCPILLNLNPTNQQLLDKPFRFQKMWLSHLDFQNLVKLAWPGGWTDVKESINLFSKRAIIWNKESFGNIFYKKKRILARLRGIQLSLAKRPPSFLTNLKKLLRAEYSTLLENERDF